MKANKSIKLSDTWDSFFGTFIRVFSYNNNLRTSGVFSLVPISRPR